MHFGGMGFIGAQEVLAWGRLHEVADLQTLWRHVHAIDLAYVADWNEKQSREAGHQHQRAPDP
jgi:hypothetical protein